MTAQFALNTAASAMDHIDPIIGELIALAAREGWGKKKLLSDAIGARRKLHTASDALRAAAMDIHNERRRYQREVGATSLREIA